MGYHENNGRRKNVDFSFRYVFLSFMTEQSFIVISWQEKMLSTTNIFKFLFLTTFNKYNMFKLCTVLLSTSCKTGSDKYKVGKFHVISYQKTSILRSYQPVKRSTLEILGLLSSKVRIE